MRENIKEILLSEEQIQNKVRELAAILSAEYEGKNPIFVGVLKGVVMFFGDIEQILIQLALIRSAGKEKLIPFFSELKQVSETASGKRAPAVETETYKNSIVEAIGHDYCASLFFKKSDFFFAHFVSEKR